MSKPHQRGLLDRIGRAIAAAAEEPRPREVALLVAVLLGVLLYLPLRLTFGALEHDEVVARAVRGTDASSLLIQTVDPKGELQVPTPPYVTASDDDAVGRNPFAFVKKARSPTPTPTPRPTPKPRGPTPPPPPPTPKPTPRYEPPFTVLGLGDKHGTPFVFLKSENAVHAALVGQQVTIVQADGREERHEIRSISFDKVTVGPADNPDAQAVLELEEAAAAANPRPGRPGRAGRRGGRARR